LGMDFFHAHSQIVFGNGLLSCSFPNCIWEWTSFMLIPKLYLGMDVSYKLNLISVLSNNVSK